MAAWFSERIVDAGRLPLFCFFAGMLVGFGFIRLSVRMIRANVRWWPGNVTPGGVHIHHVVFGVIFMVTAGVAGFAMPDDLTGWQAVAAAGFGVGAALVFDEFALILHLSDVYWSEQGRSSVDAVFAVTAVTGLLLLGLHPFIVDDLELTVNGEPVTGLWTIAPMLVLLGLAAVTVLKGKIWTGMLGCFVPLVLLVAAVRLARPESPWARWRYRPGSQRGARKQVRAEQREARLRQPVIRAKDWLQDLIAGAPNRPDGS
jgi:hypothetical protein